MKNTEYAGLNVPLFGWRKFLKRWVARVDDRLWAAKVLRQSLKSELGLLKTKVDRIEKGYETRIGRIEDLYEELRQEHDAHIDEMMARL